MHLFPSSSLSMRLGSIMRTLNITRGGPGSGVLSWSVRGGRNVHPSCCWCCYCWCWEKAWQRRSVSLNTAAVVGVYTLKGNSRRVVFTTSANRHDRIGVHGQFVENKSKRRGEEGSQTDGENTARNKNKKMVYVIGNPIQDDDGGKTRKRKTVPDAPVPDGSEIQKIVEFVQEQKRMLCITGAGCSTESRIPDYRSPNGAYSTGFKPMTHQQFMASEENRSRYWARSYAGWEHFSKVEPNQAHASLARLQKYGFLDHIITQNVDRLHHKAGSHGDKVLELHGTTHRVICMDCGALHPRELVQGWLSQMNFLHDAHTSIVVTEKNTLGEEDQEKLLREAGMAVPLTDIISKKKDEQRTLKENPDGDVDLDEDASRGFRVPACPSCKIGILKPDVVFFGDSLPPERTEKSMGLAARATGVLVVGSSLTVWSAFRIVKAAKENGSKICIINVGDTRADKIADLKINAIAGEVLSHVVTTTPQFLVPNSRCSV
eukprot:jgi/Picsp_1/5642/NSC_03001-R1_sirtuin 2